MVALGAVAAGGALFVFFASRGGERPSVAPRPAPESTTSSTVPATVPPPRGGPPTAEVGQTFRLELARILRTSGTLRVSSGDLPPGLRLEPDGVLAGRPSVAGSYTFDVGAARGASTTRRVTVTVRPPAQTGYDARVASVIRAHVQQPWPPLRGCTVAIGSLTYATAALWRGEHVADANNRLAQLDVANLAGECAKNRPRAKASALRESIWLNVMLRPYFLYRSGSSYVPGKLSRAAEDNLAAQIGRYARQYCTVKEANGSPWAFSGSENFYEERTSFCLLAAQVIRDRPGLRQLRYADGTTVAQQLPAWEAHWRRALEARATHGLWVEVNSGYHGYTIDGIYNLYNFADDPMLRRMAGYLLDLDFADFAQAQLGNVPGGGGSRVYPSDAHDAARNPMKLFADLVFGPHAPGPSNHILVLATSGYYPPDAIVQLATNVEQRGTYEYLARRPGVGRRNGTVKADASVLHYAYVTPHYVLGGAVLDPRQEYVIESGQNRWQGVIFDRGTDARVYTQVGPSGGEREVKAYDAFATVQKLGAMVTRKQGYARDSTQIYFGKSLGRIEERNGWLFVDNGESFLAVRPQQGGYRWLSPRKNADPDPARRFIVLEDGNSPIIFEAATASDYDDLQAFERDIEDNARSYVNGVMRYTSSAGHELTLGADAMPSVDGQPVDFAPPDLFRSPHISAQWGSGRITIRSGKLAASYDFSQQDAPRRFLVQPR